MEENTSMFTNKIIGILVAVVVLATVLVPICNAFSNNGGSEGTVVYNNPGSPVSLVELDQSKEYVWTRDDGFKTGDMVFTSVEYNEELSGYEIISEADWVFYDGIYAYKLVYVQNVWQLYYKFDDSDWEYLMSMYDNMVLMYDSDSNMNCIVFNGEEIPPEFNFTQYALNDIRLSPNSQYQWDITLTDELLIYNLDIGTVLIDYNLQISNDVSEIPIEEVWLITDDDWSELEFSVISPITTSIQNDGTVKFSSFVINIEGNEYELEIQADLGSITDYHGGVLIPKSVEIQSNSTNGGISSTLIGIIPVFVAVALLGAIASFIFNRKETA